MRMLTFLGSALPLIQAPMAGVQDSDLAIAVCQAGGIGSIPAAMLSNQQLADELSNISKHTDKPYNVNFFCHSMPDADDSREQAWQQRLKPYLQEFDVNPDSIPSSTTRQPFSAEKLAILADFKPAIVSFHFGIPEASLIEQIKNWGGMVISTATTIAEAHWLETHGCDAIIAQGIEAGGHRGMFLTDDLSTQCGTLALLPQIVHAVNIPVIAAGGMSDASTVKAAMDLGAQAVQVGTAYLLCDEAKTSALHRAAIKSERAQHTAITNVFTGRPARGIVNRAINELGPICDEAPDFPLAANAIGAIKIEAEKNDCCDFSSLWRGQNASGCHEISASSLTQLLFPDAAKG